MLMGYFYICDRTDVFSSSKKVRDDDILSFNLISRFWKGLSSYTGSTLFCYYSSWSNVMWKDLNFIKL